ncbi:MAG: XTP/dITP diphosphohydrolase [Lysobacterales bacterium]|jgi:XTP/dITP diphosphohydrolase
MTSGASNHWVLASGNQGKLAEFAGLLGPLGLQLSPQSQWNVPEAVEDASTFLENALIKARNACVHTGLPSLSDDSGLVVPALGGAPGILSARYAGESADSEANNDKLLQAMTDIKPPGRAAYFHCVIVLMRSAHDPVPLVAVANWHGEITRVESGGGGFGYDPVFFLPELSCTSAELSREDKGRLSHRGQAIRKLLSML